MKVNQVKQIIADYLDNSDIFAAIYTRQDADEYLEEQDKHALTDDEYLELIRRMETDDAIWTEIANAWRYYIQDLMEQREKGKINVGSK